MDLQVTTKLGAVAVALATLITAFSLPAPDRAVKLSVTPSVSVLPEPTPALGAASKRGPQGPVANPRFVLRATGYNSMVSQTNSQPFVTATGARTQWGVIAVSRDLLGGEIPYGSLVRLRDLGSYHGAGGYGAYQPLLDQTLFMVEDTMHARKRQQVDLWFEHLHEARQWGVRRVEVEVVRYGRHGPLLDPGPRSPSLAATPQLPSSR